MQELNGLKARLTQENFELHRQVQELDSNNAALAKARTQLQQQLDDAKARLEEESRVCYYSQAVTYNHLSVLLLGLYGAYCHMLWARDTKVKMVV